MENLVTQKKTLDVKLKTISTDATWINLCIYACK